MGAAYRNLGNCRESRAAIQQAMVLAQHDPAYVAQLQASLGRCN
jgi:Flp pilus assembly protein TadD